MRSGVGALAVVRALLLASAALAAGLAHDGPPTSFAPGMPPEPAYILSGTPRQDEIGRPGSVVPGDLDLHLADREHHALTQAVRSLLAARASHQRLHGALEVVARQARA